ncbi:hypothetical protein RJT34_31378 [Clitoria ternatea]|uniref:Uncharacterized protein n=1 Tax=Clitoria ternatea TaxID=43366 RepID=A0AAN9EUX8_CLITE
MSGLGIKFREFIPSILNVSRQCLASGEEDIAIISSEIFDELIESPAPLLGDSVKSTPEIISLYESVLPCILNALEDASDEVKETSYYALAAFCENMGEEILFDIDERDDEIANGFRGVSSNDEAHDEPRVQNISITTGVSDDKAAATQALGLFAQHTKTFCMVEDDDKEVVAQACTSVADIIKDYGHATVEPIEKYTPKKVNHDMDGDKLDDNLEEDEDEDEDLT